jgi:hypothetical protein
MAGEDGIIDGLSGFKYGAWPDLEGVVRGAGWATVGSVARKIDQPDCSWHVEDVGELVKTFGPDAGTSGQQQPVQRPGP